MQGPAPARVRFGSFELDLKSGELCSIGTASPDNKVLLREQAFQILRMLIQSRGKIVTREDIKNKLWPNDTIVDFDHSINAAIKTLRRALGDSADNPQYIETLARRGYRLRVDIEWLETKIETPLPNIANPQSFPGLADLAGKRVSHYRVLEIIGSGGMGMVYKAEDLKLARLVALKFLPEELATDPVALRRFEREAQSASALNHPNICTIHEIEEHEGQPFIVMELLEGESLLGHMKALESKAMPLAPLLDIAIQVCNGLQAAHDKGIIHRDIKPANLFLTRQGRVKILDFGLAMLAVTEDVLENRATKAANASSANSNAIPVRTSGTTQEEFTGRLTRLGIAIGTAAYMSPEQIQKDPLDVRTDLFSFGLVLYEMATGQNAFTGETEIAVHDAILNRTPRSARDLNSAVPRDLDATITKALEKDRSQRYQSAAEMRADLERVQKEMHPPLRRFRRWLAYSAILLVIAAAVWIYRGRHRQALLSSNDSVVRADINNHTGDAVLDDGLNAALYFGLEQTPYLNILGFDKVFGTLQQLGLPLNGKVTSEIARQICLKTNSKMVVDSSIADAGNRFQIEIKAIGCQSGGTLAQVQRDARAREEIVHELGVAAVELRRKLGEPEASIAKFNKPLEEATSSSPEALQLLNQGYRYQLVFDSRNANALYQRAVELDPGFALAWHALGATYYNLGDLVPAKAAMKKAYDLRDRMTVPGRFQVESGYYDLTTGELEKSYSVYLQWVDLFPQDLIARINLARCLVFLGRTDQAIVYRRMAVRLSPSNVTYGALIDDYTHLNRLNEAKATFDEAEARKLDSDNLRIGRAMVAFLEKDNAAMEEQWSWAEGKEGSGLVIYGKSLVEAYYGRLHEAQRTRKLARSIRSNAPGRISMVADEALIEAEVGDFRKALRTATSALAGSPDRGDQFTLAQAFALAGDLTNAQKLADVLNKDYPLDTLAQNYSLPVVWATMKLHTNDPAGAVEILRAALKYELSFNNDLVTLYPAYIRGLAYLQMGDGLRAALEFQKLLVGPGWTGTQPIGALSHLQMARAQKLSGNDAAARKWYEDFLTLWKDADPDIPVYQQAKAEYARLLSSGRMTEPTTSRRVSEKP